MGWIKKGRLLEINNSSDWMYTHATLPIFFPVDEKTFRIYFSTRNKEGKSYPAYAVFDRNTWEIIEICEKPLLQWGKPGTFDDNGIMCSCLVKCDDKVYMYYIGWNQLVKVHYHVSIGLAISSDGGKTFKKYSDGPIVDRSQFDPVFCTTPFVIRSGNKWKMWYSSCTEWLKKFENYEPIYNIKYIESNDGINWDITKIEQCIDYQEDFEAIARPWVVREDNVYKMWYSYRVGYDYRINKNSSYKIGYAESVDGHKWNRKDDSVEIGLSEDGWDSQMLCYNSIFEEDGKKYMLYNGNTFGKTGFGVAVWSDDIDHGKDEAL